MARPSVDLMARWVVMSSFLYYGLDQPFLSDAEYDAAAQRVLKEWGEVTPIRRWQLGSKDALAATGFLIKATPYSVHGAIAWAGIKSKVVPTQPWRRGPAEFQRVRWLNVGHFTYA